MKNLNKLIQARFDQMCQSGKLFRSTVTGDQLWQTYLEGFVEEAMFRDPESSEHNCNHCKNFIKRYGNVVAVIDGKIATLFDVETTDEYQNSMNLMSNILKRHYIKTIFVESRSVLNNLTYEKLTRNMTKYALGIPSNTKVYTQEEADKFGVVTPGQVYTFNHMMVNIPAEFINTTMSSNEALAGQAHDKFKVMVRGMKEFSKETLDLVRDLIEQDSLLNGSSYIGLLSAFRTLVIKYQIITSNEDLTAAEIDHLLWEIYSQTDDAVATFRNTLIGQLCIELSQGDDLEKACLAWNRRADPVNYRKATAPITQKQINEAQKFVEDNGYLDSFNRRLATMDDIQASEILHMNSSSKTFSIFDKVTPTKQPTPSNFKNVKECTIQEFIKDILPTAREMEVFFENKHRQNLCTLTTSVDSNSKKMFKYDNNFSKTFFGNLAGRSFITDTVDSLGGNIEGLLRFSIGWAEDTLDDSDLDAHCKISKNNIISEIYYGRRESENGTLDIDIVSPQYHKKATNKGVVENIVFTKLSADTYQFFINGFSVKNSAGFTAEIDLLGDIFEYTHKTPVGYKERIAVATVQKVNNKYEITHHLTPSTSKSNNHWNLNTGEFHKVKLICESPNYWGERKVGNNHYLFMLENCKIDSPIRSFHNEDLNEELLAHRKVMEVLGSTTKIEPTDDQLSGLGFNVTVREEVIVRVDKIIYKINI